MKRPDGSLWQLGSGGFGTVYKAMRNGVQPVAVKALGSVHGEPTKPMTDSDFAHEITILRACRDSNILQFQVRRLPRVWAFRGLVSETTAHLLLQLQAPQLMRTAPAWPALLCRERASRTAARCW